MGDAGAPNQSEGSCCYCALKWDPTWHRRNRLKILPKFLLGVGFRSAQIGAPLRERFPLFQQWLRRESAWGPTSAQVDTRRFRRRVMSESGFVLQNGLQAYFTYIISHMSSCTVPLPRWARGRAFRRNEANSSESPSFPVVSSGPARRGAVLSPPRLAITHSIAPISAPAPGSPSLDDCADGRGPKPRQLRPSSRCWRCGPPVPFSAPGRGSCTRRAPPSTVPRRLASGRATGNHRRTSPGVSAPCVAVPVVRATDRARSVGRCWQG